MHTTHEILRSSWTLDGQRIYLLHDPRRGYLLATRWRYLARFDRIHDACDGFEVLEMSEGEPVELGRHIKAEVERNPRASSAGPAHRRIAWMAEYVERRQRGLRPRSCGRKGAVTRWVPARGQAH